MHYANDPTISITQNRCFKKVIKDIAVYELATEAKVNFDTTKGLWTGTWKSRGDTPLGINWKNKNVHHLGVYMLIMIIQHLKHLKESFQRLKILLMSFKLSTLSI